MRHAKFQFFPNIKFKDLIPSWKLDKYPVFYRSHWINSLSFFLLSLFVVTFLFGFFFRPLMVLSLTILVFFGSLFFVTRSIARGLSVSRVIDKKSVREGEEFQVTYKVNNNSSFLLRRIFISDFTSIKKDKWIHFSMDQKVRSSRFFLKDVKVKTETGMGKHSFSQMVVQTSDLLGVFQFEKIFDEVSETIVYPKVSEIESMPEVKDINSFKYGKHDVLKKGESIIFSGVRPFSRGDSMKHIAWKLSAKKNELLTKEFERSVNVSVSVVLDLKPEKHFGDLSESTWAYGRNLAVSILSHEIDEGNSVRFISNFGAIEAGEGADYLMYLSRHILEQTPIYSGDSLEYKHLDLLADFKPSMPSGSVMYYITPYNVNKFASTMSQLKIYQELGVDVRCLLINTNSFVQSFASNLEWQEIAALVQNSKIEEYVFELKTRGIQAWVFNQGDGITKVFLNG